MCDIFHVLPEIIREQKVQEEDINHAKRKNQCMEVEDGVVTKKSRAENTELSEYPDPAHVCIDNYLQQTLHMPLE